MILGQQFSRYREKIVTYTNQRIHAFEEFINGCQTIKIYNWEKYIETRVIRIRELELAAIRRTSFLRAINVAVFFAAMPLIGFSTYVGAWFTGRQLKVIDIFITLGFYSQIRDPIMYALPLAIEKFIDLRLAWQRIDRLIQLMIKEGDRTLHTFDIDHYQQKGAITMWNASFSWNGHDDCLSSLNIDIKPGTFVGITGVSWFGMRRLTEAQNLMTSAERIDEYARLSQEEDNGGSKRLIRTPTDWPNRGAIEFRNYSLRYRSNLEPALRNINLAIKPCERIGIMGRTGAGKSSLFQSLLRLVDRSTIDGNILIDDIDISRITLNHLRSHISVIPQQFVLFAGTLRSNIDPLDAYSDEQCWTALEAVQLKSMASHHPAGLLMPVAESGSNLSIGQCQLICVCRAILKSSKILLIDEATANVDNDTDQMLQSIIAEITKNRTVLTIAHRLNTVIGSDRLLAVDNGMIVDFDVPNKVLKCFQ
ncbi:unnamed protein product [Rotaria sp. Silwood1]|nr:unnamed protein product [Rotaria sp. Silwood1]